MIQVKAGLVMRGFNLGIVDEVDSILIDEARTPIIISGSAGRQSQRSKLLWLIEFPPAFNHYFISYVLSDLHLTFPLFV